MISSISKFSCAAGFMHYSRWKS